VTSFLNKGTLFHGLVRCVTVADPPPNDHTEIAGYASAQSPHHIARYFNACGPFHGRAPRLPAARPVYIISSPARAPSVIMQFTGAKVGHHAWIVDSACGRRTGENVPLVPRFCCCCCGSVFRAFGVSPASPSPPTTNYSASRRSLEFVTLRQLLQLLLLLLAHFS
jgi:hypothetical protein